MAVVLRSPQKAGIHSAIWAAKLAFLLAGIFSIAAFAKIAVPYTAALLASSLPRAWSALRTWLVPPYLFITVHLIIIVIWKLSDQKHPHSWPADDRSLDSIQPLKPKDFGASHLPQKPSPETWREMSPNPPESDAATPAPAKELGEPSPPSDVSCLTTDSDEKSTAASRLDVKKIIASSPDSVESVVEEESVPAPGMEIEENDSMDGTWKAIMERSMSRSRSRSSQPETTAGRGMIRAAPAVADPDEMNRRFEDFIKKKKDEIRLQRHESDQRKLEMVNRALY